MTLARHLRAGDQIDFEDIPEEFWTCPDDDNGCTECDLIRETAAHTYVEVVGYPMFNDDSVTLWLDSFPLSYVNVDLDLDIYALTAEEAQDIADAVNGDTIATDDVQEMCDNLKWFDNVIAARAGRFWPLFQRVRAKLA